ncbi:MAG: serine/threonine-protein kinase [Kofleriaceae bacterium]|nr:serine/threonine-protein kinase [Kofleriaceae bacterium]
MTDRSPDLDADVVEAVEPIERDGRETLLPSVTRSVLTGKHFVATELTTGESIGSDDSWDGTKRGAKGGDIIGGRYLVEGQLGRGGMGRVMRVRHQALGKAFALKLIKTRMATDPKIREMFYREARLASALTHDNICSIVDFGSDERFGLFMVMELLDGHTVHHRLKQSGRLSPKVACDIMWQTADAVRFIHSRAILHGDIKTENIFMVKTTMTRRLVKLLDFGLARPDLGRREVMDGTPEYIAPERIDGAPCSQASDIYALGIVFFELLTASLPFTGSLEEILLGHRDKPMPVPSKRLADPLDERADELILRATAKDPAKRHPDLPAFMYELRALMTMLGMDQQGGRRRALAPDAARERRELDQRIKAGNELFTAASLPMASVDRSGTVRVANPAFCEFIGSGNESPHLDLRTSALPDVYPTLFEDLKTCAAQRRVIKRVIQLHEGGDRIVEAAVVLSPSPSASEATAGEVHLVLHPLRTLG